MDIVLAIIASCLGSSGLFALLQFLISRRDRKRDDLGKIKEQLIVAEKDSCRTQLLLMMALYPEDHAEIMKLAKHYFDDLDGDWYLTSIFCNWLKGQNIGEPVWFKRTKYE